MPAASATPLFDSLLVAQLGDRPDLAEALCALLGRALAGDAPAMPLWIAGPGQTGKTVLARAFEALFPPDAVGYPESARSAIPPGAAVLLAHERPDADVFRALDGGALPGLAVCNLPPPPRAEGAGRLALFRFDNRVEEPDHDLLPRILAAELPALRARLLFASRALSDHADPWAALPEGVVA
jgi:hypothetical protein